MAAYTQLSVTTSAGTTTAQLGNENTITIDSPAGSSGLAAAIRTPHTFKGFLQWGPNRVDLDASPRATEVYEGIYPGAHRVSGLSYAAGVITVTESGTPSPTNSGFPSDPWTQTTAVSVDSSSALVIDGHGIAARQTIPLNGLSAISLTEATA